MCASHVRKLYWVDAWSKTLEHVDLSDNSASMVMSLARQATDNPLFGLTVRGTLLYTTVWNTGAVLEIDVSSNNSKTLHQHLGRDAMFDITYVDYNKQKQAIHPCGESNKGGCSHLCLPTEGAKHRCTCPTFGGKSLAADERTCKEPENLLLYAISDQGQGQVGFLDLDGAPSVERTLVAKSVRPVAIGYDPTKQHVYWSDVHERTIHRAFLNGTEHHIFLNHNHSLGVVDGLFVNWKHGNLYYSNMGHVFVERTAFSWHKVEMVTLEGSTRKTVVTQVEKPRAIAVDMDRGYLFYSDWGENAKIVRCELDGSNPYPVRHGLENPNGIALYGGELHVVDARANSREDPDGAVAGSLYSSTRNGKTWKEAEGLDLGVPFGVARYNNKIFISDWEKKGILVSTIDNQGLVQNHTTLLGEIDSPMGLFYSKRVLYAEPVADVCEISTRCDEVCTVTPSGGSKCSCDSYSPEALAMDNSTCKVPQNFLIVSDMNSIKLRSLDAVDKELSTLVRGNSYFSNFAALVYDSSREIVYFSDVNRKKIFSSSIDGKNVMEFHSSNDVIDGIALDLANQRLFWTEFYSGSIVSKDLIGSQARTLMSGISKPRAVQVDGVKGMLYWTEWGKSPKVGQLDLNAKMASTLMGTEVREPNGLYLDLNKNLLYVGDAGKRTIFRCNLNTTVCKEMTFTRHLPMHIFDLKVKDDWILYSDWLEHSIMAISMTTGQQEVLVRGLMRPTVFVIQNGKDNDCPPTSGCSDLCVTLAGNFLCTCRPGRRLASDGKTCIKDVSWLPGDAYHCQDGCLSNTTCSRFQATVNYSCQCLPGFTATPTAPPGGCIKCSENHYKAEIGPAECVPCPEGSHSQEGASSCVCEGGLTWDWYRRTCAGAKPGDCPNTEGSTVQCLKKCILDSDCSSALKCCRAEDCPGMQCVDPVGLEHCIYDGQVYHVGQYFSPDNCTRCQCSSIKPSRMTEYGQALCTKTKCPVLECDVTNQMHPAGVCCPLCVTEDEAHLKITDCPTEVVTLVLDSDKAYVEYSPTIEITDNTRTGREIRVTKNPQQSIFWWSGVGEKGRQKMTLTAEADAPDGSIDKDVCHFTVYVKDEAAPQISCPGDLTIYTQGGATEVTWPAPSANDNVALSSMPHLNGPITNQFTIGKHEIPYYVTDVSSNGAQCSFFVEVKLLDTKCSLPPSPYHGTLNCLDFRNKTENQLKLKAECKLTCHSGYVLNIDENFQDVYTCGKDGSWKPKFPEDFVSKACLKINMMHWWLNGTFDVVPSTTGITKERDVAVGVRNMFRQKYFHLLSFIPSLDINVTRQKMAGLHQFLVKFDIQGNQNATDTSTYDQFSQLRQQLQRDDASGRMSIHGNGEILVARELHLQEISLRCSEDEQRLPRACLVCPVGTFFEETEKKCLPCSQGFYQDLEGQRSCTKCPEGSTSPEGSFALLHCYERVGVHTASTEVPKGVIVGAVVGCLAFIVGVIVIVIVVIFIRRHLNDTKVNYIINSHENRQMEFANRAFEDHNSDVITRNKIHNGNSESHSNDLHGNKDDHMTLNNGAEVKHNGVFTTSNCASQDFGNGAAPADTAKASESVFL